jgi:mycothiol synthase
MTPSGTRDPATLPGLSTRAFDATKDFEPAAELIVTCHLADEIDWLPTAEILAHEWANTPNFAPATDARLAEVDGEPVGLATVEWRRRADKIVHHVFLWVRPDIRRHGLGDKLLTWAEGRARETVATGVGGPAELPHEIGGWGDSDVPGHAQLAARHGYRAVRYGFEMRRQVDAPLAAAPLPAGLEIRPVEPSQYRRIWDADVEAFRDHFEASQRTEEDFNRWFSAPWLDTSLWQVAWDGGEVAGSVFTSVNREENELLGANRAWLDHISVRRRWRRQGVAAALIVSTLELLRERGVEEAALGVDAENPTGALRLYERLGFVRHKTGISYRKAL